MDKRFQVFLSSTYVDLTEERLEVIKALLELDCIPCGMEYFPAASEESWSYIANLINQCDYYIVIVGGRYGSESDDGVSFTQKEYLHAQSQGIPCIAFTHANPDELPAKKTERSPEGIKKLAEFVDLLRKNRLCKNWATAPELGAVVSRSVTQLIKQHPRTGWIPANQAGNPNATEEILALTKKVSELQEELQKVRGHLTLDTTSLAEGEDSIELSVTYTVCAEVKEDRWARSRVVAKGDGRVTVTWNDLFRTIAPKIAPYASDASIQSGINGLLADRFPEPTDREEGEWISGATLTKESFNTVKIQFLALGLITVGKEEIEKEYGKKGTTGILWRLTETGTAKMMHTLAVKKPVP